MVTKGKYKQDERQTSLIPVIERTEQQLRFELTQVQHEVANQVSQAEKQAEEHVEESRHSISELVEQRREDKLADLKEQAERISWSSKKRSAHLQQMAKKNMALAVQRVVEAVIGAPYEPTAMGEQT
jgi:vacuolar-type H+-ATPase subunit H